MSKTTTTKPDAPTSKDDATAAAKAKALEAAAEKTALEAKPTPPTAEAKPLAINHDAMNDTVKSTARAFYEAYTANSNGLAWDGRPCPKWDDLNLAVKSHWCAVVIEAMAMVRGQAQTELLVLRDLGEKLKTDLATANSKLLDAQDALTKYGAAPSAIAGLDGLQSELRACRNDLKRVCQERDEANRALARIEASAKSSVQAAAASRTSMLEAEVDKLRVELAKREGELRVAAERCVELEAKLKSRTVGPS